MPRMCVYRASDGTEVNLDGDGAWVGTAPSLRGRAWTYSLSARRLSGVTRAAREVTVSAFFTDPAKADLLRHLADRDMAQGTPGRICAGEWFQRAYIVACEPVTIFGGCHSADLTVVLLDGAWSRERSMRFEVSANAGEGGYDLPCDLPCDLGAPRPASFVEASKWAESPARITFEGPCDNPRVTIGGNDYAAAASVPALGSLVVDGLSKTATLSHGNGDESDAFASCVRGTGLGCGSYAFQPLPAGRSEVSWDGSFAFGLAWYEQEGEPPWES